MANFPSKVNVPTAVTTWSKQQMRSSHVTTSNFMEFNVAKIIEYVPGQKIKNFKHEVFQRLEPMVVPTFGDANVHKLAFFVPMYTIFPAWIDFITRSIHDYADGYSLAVSKTPTVKNSTLRDVFITESVLGGDYKFSEIVTSDKCDFIVTKTGGVLEKRNFTPRGKRFYKLLRSLGYAIDFSLINTDEEKSALPLLAVAKVYYDWFFPNAYATNDIGANLAKFFNFDVSHFTGDFANEFDVYSVATIGNLLARVNYDSDYFVSAWDNPVGPNYDTTGNITLIDSTAPSTSVYKSQVKTTVFPNGTPAINNATSSTANAYNLTQYVVTGLKKLTDYMKRHQIAGARSLDRYLSRFGIQLDSEVMRRSKKLYSSQQPVMFADVTSTSDTDGAPLGAYAGKGISMSRNDDSFDFSSKDAGYIILVTTIVPKINYYQGQDRMVKHINPLDFFTPEFDNLGVQAIGVDELYVPMDSSKMYINPSSPTGFDFKDKVFGFIPRYAEYKRPLDLVTGDYILGSLNTGKDAWTFGRNVEPYFDDGLNGIGRGHSYDFVTGHDAHQYNRIFNITSEDVDQFNVVHRFSYESIFPGKSLFDSYEFDGEDKADKVTLEVGGVKTN